MHVCIVQVKSVVTYGKHWVKQQARMTSTSNQEVFRANVEGRLVIDMLRVILVSFNLSTFTLAECTQLGPAVSRSSKGGAFNSCNCNALGWQIWGLSSSFSVLSA